MHICMCVCFCVRVYILWRSLQAKAIGTMAQGHQQSTPQHLSVAVWLKGWGREVLSLQNTSSRKACPWHCGFLAVMEDCQVRESESEKQRVLPFNFRAPRLQFTKDKSEAYIFWQSQGQIIADHKQHMVNSIGKDNRTSLYSSRTAPTEDFWQ